MQSNLARSSMGRSLLIVGVAVAAALVVGGLRVGDRAPNRAVPPINVFEELSLNGGLIDATGAPIAGADVCRHLRGRNAPAVPRKGNGHRCAR